MAVRKLLLPLLAVLTLVVGIPAAHGTTSCTITGTPNADTLTGTTGKDVICGLGGDDTINALGGADSLHGGAGNDLLYGNSGNDNLTGGLGGDHLHGGPGINFCRAGHDPHDVVDGRCDSTPPVLTAFEWSTPTVNTGSGPATVTAVAHVTDDLSGPTTMQCLLKSPSESAKLYSSVPPPLLSHVGEDWEYSINTLLPRDSEGGTWSIDWCRVEDKTHNILSLTTAQMNALGFPTTFEQTDPGDSIAPTLDSFDLTTPTVATGSGAATVTANAHLTEAGSGVSFVQCLYRSPNHAAGIHTSANPQLVSHVDDDWEYELSADMPQYSAQGSWSIERCYAEDNAHNTRWYYTANLNNAGFPTSFEQIDAGDSQPPRLVDFTYSPPSTVVTITRPATINVTTRVTDDLAGLHIYMSCHYTGPNGSTALDLVGYTTSQGGLDGEYALSMEVPQYSQAGTWTLHSCLLQDMAENSGFLYRADLDAAGFPTTFTVI